MDKEKMVQIYEATADMTLEMINKEKENFLCLSAEELEMVRTTQSLYETLNYANRPVIATAFDFEPSDSSGTKYSRESSSIARPTTSHE